MHLRTFWVSVFLLTMGAFVQGMALSIYLRDAGELTAAATLLGVPHETGFPLYCLLGQFLRLLPLGEAASRLGLLSALGGAAGCATVAVLTANLGAERQPHPAPALVGGAAAGLLLCVEGTYFRAAAAPEVYTPTAAALALGLWLLRRVLADDASPAEAARAGLALALLVGLGLGLHASLRLLLGPLLLASCAYALLRRPKGPSGRWPLGAPALLGLGALVVLYLPLRAARGSLATWGEADTWPGLLAHLSAARIRDSFRNEILTTDLTRLGHRLAAFVRQVAGQLGPAAAVGLLGLLGLLGHRRRGPFALALLALVAGDTAFAAWVNPMGIADLQVGVPCAMGLCIGAGWAIGQIGRMRRLGLPAAIFVAAVLAVPAALLSAGDRADLDSGLGLRLARAALDQAPPRALLLSQSDDLSATLRYEQAVAGDRPDVAVVVRQLAWDGAYLGRALRQGAWLSPGEVAAFRALPEADRVRAAPQLLARLAQRAPERVVWEPSAEEGPPLPFSLAVPLLPLRQRALGPLPPPGPLLDRLGAILGEPRDPVGRALGARAVLRLAEAYLHAGDRRAEQLVETALQIDPTLDAAEIARGVLLARAGDLRGALASTERVLWRNPDQATAHMNAARYLLRLGDGPAAARHAREVLRLRPGHPGAQAVLSAARRP